MILITRPRDESDQLAKELSKYKLKTCIEPLISFLPCSICASVCEQATYWTNNYGSSTN